MIGSKLLDVEGEGFTIIEVMIVLAIAALILLIVFMAVPALQRNNRNLNRKTDVARMATDITTYYGNTGSLPPICDGNPGPLCTTLFQDSKLEYYDPGNVGFCPVGGLCGPPTSSFNTEWLQYFAGYICSASSPTTVTTSGADGHNVVAVYYLEGDDHIHCQLVM